jgi:transposase
VIKLDDWAKIRHLFSTGKHSKREISRIVGVSRGTVERALEADRAPRYDRAPTGSMFDAYQAKVRTLLAVTPTMPASTLAERVDWPGSPSLFRARVAQIRPEYLPPDPADRLVHEPGFQVQCDLWFPREPLPLGHGQEDKPPVLVMTSTFSGFIQARMLPTRTTSDLLGGMWSLLEQAQAVPMRLLWDNETGIGRGKVTVRATAFAGTLGCEIKLLPPRDPESKGMVERMNRFFRQRFMPGRTFVSPHDFNDQLDLWLPKANARFSRSRGASPAELIRVDRAKMRVLPPMVPDVVFRNTVRLPRDYYVRVFANDYSVDPTMIGRLVEVSATLNMVIVTHEGLVVASHQRIWARRMTITDPVHVAQAAILRRQFQTVKRRPPVGLETVETRELATYDQLFGINLFDIDHEATIPSWERV